MAQGSRTRGEPRSSARFRLAILLLAAALAGLAASGGTSAPALSPRQAQVYQAICATCHAAPGSGAPVTGDSAAWQVPNRQGFAALLLHTVDGTGSMPPLGTCGSCSEADLRALIAYMSGLPDPGL